MKTMTTQDRQDARVAVVSVALIVAGIAFWRGAVRLWKVKTFEAELWEQSRQYECRRLEAIANHNATALALLTAQAGQPAAEA